MRKPLIAGNWKMFKTTEEALSLVEGIRAGVHKVTNCTVVICPPFTALDAVAKALKGSSVDLGAQNMHPQTEGAYTGEISPVMIKELGCRYVILGHSERRQYFGESDLFINQKVKTAIKYSLIPIVCVGETLEQRESKQFLEVVKKQIDCSLADLTKEDIAKVVLAYEPVWAIGTGRTASPEQAEQMQSYIRRLLNEKYGQDVAQKIWILYGGSVKPDNMAALIAKPNVDGALVGGASLKAESFTEIVLNAAKESLVGKAS
ncbi:MAG: triose-phosphate isomerase [Candidatus Omnitrophica bacterium]|nr:triose-phosphate isomerase [Candidatus Omnitrophota bacterium]MDD5670656.1 triose-phosphate isomerase [Candidatus Omnitrophota bacterium]